MKTERAIEPPPVRDEPGFGVRQVSMGGPSMREIVDRLSVDELVLLYRMGWRLPKQARDRGKREQEVNEAMKKGRTA